MPPHACGCLRATMWVLGLELKSSWLAAGTFTSRAILPTPVFIFYNFPPSIIITLSMESLKSTSDKFSWKNIFVLNIFVFVQKIKKTFYSYAKLHQEGAGCFPFSTECFPQLFLSLVWSYHCGQPVVHPCQLSHLPELTRISRTPRRHSKVKVLDRCRVPYPV